MKINHILIAVAAMMLLASCCRKHIPVAGTHSSDSTVVKEVISYRDTVIYSPVDSSAIRAEVKCPENGVVNLPEITRRSRNAIVKVRIDSNQVVASCVCDSLEQRVKLQDRTIHELRQRRSETVQIVREQYVPKVIQALAWLGGLSFVTGLIFIIIKLK